MQIAQIKLNVKRFESVLNLDELAVLTNCSKSQLVLMANNPEYSIYEIPKRKKGEVRLIEDPNEELKDVLTRLNTLLQCVYLKYRPNCVYGFTIRRGNEEERNILNNATQHIGCKYLLNIDLKDFFHNISRNRVLDIFKKYGKKSNKELLATLAKIVTFKSRLPMGAPTSPVLSNFALIELDNQLEALCKNLNIVYTRFADDFSFSSLFPIDEICIDLIKSTIEQFGLIINENKVHLYTSDAEKIVTGLIVKDTVCLPKDYLSLLKMEINNFANLMATNNRYKLETPNAKVNLIKQEIKGKWNFANLVEPENALVLELYESMQEIFELKNVEETIDWLDLPDYWM